MITNKENTAMKTVAVILLIYRSDLLQPMRCISKANNDTYGCWSQILWKYIIKN